MFKSSVRNILVTVNAVSLILLFSISSYAGYSFKEDGDAINERFSGTNYVYTNGIYVGEMGAIDAYMDNYGNTYNGTNIIDATAYPGVGQDDESTYNGTLDVTANDILSSKTTVDDATVNAATTVTVNEVLDNNDLNAGVQFNNSDFNGDVTLSGSGAVNLEGSTINNLVLGNIPQFQTLLNYVKSIEVLLRFNVRDLTTASADDYKLYNLDSHNIYLRKYNIFYKVFNENTNTVTEEVIFFYGTFLGYLHMAFSWQISSTIYQNFRWLVYNINNNFNTFWSAYLPNKSLAQAQYWIAYNTDTDSYDSVNLATVFGYMTWYLGQMYVQGNEAASDISQSVTNLADTLTDFETKEGQINNSIKSSLNNVDSFFQLPAVTAAGTVIGWLQYMWVSLGTFQAVTIIAWALVILTIVTGFYKVKRITV